MKYGLSVATVGDFAEPRIQMELAALAESEGWDGYFVWDAVAHHWRPVLDPWIALAAVAAVTSRIAIGPMVAAFVFGRPRQLAASIASLERLSPGRLIVGAGASDAPEQELQAMGEPALAERARVLDSSLEAVAAALKSEHISVPIWIGASDPLHKRAALRRAARYEGVFPMGTDRPPAEVAQIARYVRERRGGDFDLAIPATFAGKSHDERTQLVDDYTTAGATWLIEGLMPWERSLAEARTLIREGLPG